MKHLVILCGRPWFRRLNRDGGAGSEYKFVAPREQALSDCAQHSSVRCELLRCFALAECFASIARRIGTRETARLPVEDLRRCELT